MERRQKLSERLVLGRFKGGRSAIRSMKKRVAVPAALLSLLAGLSACGKFEVDKSLLLKGPSTSSDPLKAKEENKAKSLAGGTNAGNAGGKTTTGTGTSTGAGKAAPSDVRELFCPELAATDDALKPCANGATLGEAPKAAGTSDGNTQQQTNSRSEFIKSLSLVVSGFNEEILKQRIEVMKLQLKVAGNETLSDDETKWLTSLKEQYQLAKDAPMDQVLDRVDMVPEEVILAPLAVETNFGTGPLTKTGFFASELMANPAMFINEFVSPNAAQQKQLLAARIKALNTSTVTAAVNFRVQRGYQRAEGSVNKGEFLMAVFYNGLSNEMLQKLAAAATEIRSTIRSTVDAAVQPPAPAAQTAQLVVTVGPSVGSSAGQSAEQVAASADLAPMTTAPGSTQTGSPDPSNPDMTTF